jgi:hypothetical protein
MIPSMYAYINQLYFHSGLLFFTSLISVNFWRKANYSWRRNMDLIVAKISFTIFTYNGIIYVNYTPHLIIVYIGLFMIIYCYHLSEKLHKINNNNWYKYHMLFHFSMMCEQLIILNSLSKTKMLNLN